MPTMPDNDPWTELARWQAPVNRRQVRLWRRCGGYYEKTEEFRLLKEIEEQRESIASEASDGRNVSWLLPYRHRFRKSFARLRSLCRKDEVDVIRYYMAGCPQEMFALCIWMIGQCAARLHLPGIDDYCFHPDPQIRRHVAKALRRLEAWALLEMMSGAYFHDPVIQRYAKTITEPHRPFTERLARFKRLVDDSHASEVVTPSRMPFWAAERVWDYTPPKSVQLIRRMLQRIRHWVRWGVS
ncbi:MAG TPA: hypothetical protein VHK01_07205 [Lacipirellulaceae bacterium]|jgi:hypothetical protein|nr:hypothetical protein [Lacipirellulaceae bacterium]